MTRGNKMALAALLGVLAVALMASLAMGGLALAAPAVQTAVAPVSQTKTGGPGMALEQVFTKAFAARLGVDEAKLNEAFSGAIGDTTAEAVRQGQLTQAQADAVNGQSKAGLGALIAGAAKTQLGKQGDQRVNAVNNEMLAKQFGMTGSELETQLKAGKTLEQIAADHNVSLDQLKAGMVAQLNSKSTDSSGDRLGLQPAAIAKLLNMTGSDLEKELKAGKSIAQVAQEHNVDLATVKASALTSVKADLDNAVMNGKLSQQDADNMLTKMASQIDAKLSTAGNAPSK